MPEIKFDYGCGYFDVYYETEEGGGEVYNWNCEKKKDLPDVLKQFFPDDELYVNNFVIGFNKELDEIDLYDNRRKLTYYFKQGTIVLNVNSYKSGNDCHPTIIKGNFLSIKQMDYIEWVEDFGNAQEFLFIEIFNFCLNLQEKINNSEIFG